LRQGADELVEQVVADILVWCQLPQGLYQGRVEIGQVDVVLNVVGHIGGGGGSFTGGCKNFFFSNVEKCSL
jgi:hypothetical protein